MGISAEDLPHIFEPYYRGEQSRTVRQSGSGLGLAIVKKIVEAHDGRIEVESAVGKGSTFRVFLPRLKIASLGADVPSEAT
jgi:signal transduction histidine kinase